MSLPDLIYAQASPLSIGGKSMFEPAQEIRAPHSFAFASHPVTVVDAAARLRAAGFEILQVTPMTINIAGEPDAYEKAFRTKIVEKELARPMGDSITFLDSP